MKDLGQFGIQCGYCSRNTGEIGVKTGCKRGGIWCFEILQIGYILRLSSSFSTQITGKFCQCWAMFQPAIVSPLKFHHIKLLFLPSAHMCVI